MALATTAEVEASLGRPLAPAESDRADFWLRRASALVSNYTGRDFTDTAVYATVPADVADVVGEMVARAIAQAGSYTPGVERQVAGPFATNFSTSSQAGGPWLSSTDKLVLKQFRAGVTSIGLSSERRRGFRFITDAPDYLERDDEDV